MYCRPYLFMRIELNLPEIIDTLDLEIILKYYLDDRDPSIQEILKEYGRPKIDSLRIYTSDGYIRPIKTFFTAFKFDILAKQGINPNRLTYKEFIQHIFENCITYL